MAKRGRSGAGDFMDLVALLPWWGGVALAAVGYVVFDRLSASPVAPMQAGRMDAFVQQALVAGLASAARVVVPLLCLAGALVSFLRRQQRRKLVANVVASDSAAALDGMSWREFELLVGEHFRRQGYRVTEQGGSRADGGVDLILQKDREIYLVQCKQWKAFKVGVAVVRELYGVMAARGATGGFVVTSGTFTDEATRFADGRNVTLLDGAALQGLIRSAKTPAMAAPAMAPGQHHRPSKSFGPSLPVKQAPSPDAPKHAEAETMAAPACPVCQAMMVRRMARTGPRTGTSFWGCSRFPGCRGTR